MTPARVVAFVAGAAIAGLSARALRLAVADPAEAGAGDPPARSRRTATFETATEPDAPVRTKKRWSAPKQPRVSAGVLVRAASRKPLDRAPVCRPPERARTRETRAPVERCPPPERGDAEHIEIDWHADPATP